MDLFEAVTGVVPKLAASQRDVLQALMFAPRQSASARQLRSILGLAAIVQINGAMGQVGRKVYEAMRVHPDGLLNGEFEWWHMLATGEATAQHGFVWTLRDDVVRALRLSGMSTTGEREASEVSEPETLWEGAVRQITVNAYERNPFARVRCIEAHGTACAACGMDFGKTYGEVFAANCIHVHHLHPLSLAAQSSNGDNYEIDPVKDLRPVCPNCHAVIHKVDPPHSIEYVKELLNLSNRVAPKFALT